MKILHITKDYYLKQLGEDKRGMSDLLIRNVLLVYISQRLGPFFPLSTLTEICFIILTADPKQDMTTHTTFLIDTAQFSTKNTALSAN